MSISRSRTTEQIREQLRRRIAPADPGRAVHSRGTKIVRGQSDMVVYIYEIQESALDKLSSSTASDTYLNLFIGSASILVTSALTVLTNETLQGRVYWIAAFMAFTVLTAVFLGRWLQLRGEKSRIIAEIKSQIQKVPVEAQEVSPAEALKKS